jgi:hypothetical protein
MRSWASLPSRANRCHLGKSLQSHGALLCKQHHTLQRLVLEINNKVGIVGILKEAQRGAIDEATHQISDSGDYAVAFANVSGCMEDLGMFVKDRLSAKDSGIVRNFYDCQNPPSSNWWEIRETSVRNR